MGTEIATNDKNPVPPNGKGMLPPSAKKPLKKTGTERDIMQLVEELTEVMQDGLFVRVIVDGLRGNDRSLLEQLLASLRDIPEEKGTERDIMQFADDLFDERPELPPEIFEALNHLLGNRPSCLWKLVQIARKGHDWRTLPDPIKP